MHHMLTLIVKTEIRENIYLKKESLAHIIGFSAFEADFAHFTSLVWVVVRDSALFSAIVAEGLQLSLRAASTNSRPALCHSAFICHNQMKKATTAPDTQPEY